jgi:DNA adenine methylase
MKPIIKWVGGKSQLLDKIHEMLPVGFDPKVNTYYEPFLGGAAVLLSLNPTKAVVSDINSELINMYQQVKCKPEIVVSDLKKFDMCHEGYDNPKVFYYDVRNDFNKYLGDNTPTQAARFIYLNKHCFNGCIESTVRVDLMFLLTERLQGSLVTLTTCAQCLRRFKA